MAIRKRFFIAMVTVLLLTCSLLLRKTPAVRPFANYLWGDVKQQDSLQQEKALMWYLTSISASPDGKHLAVKYAERKGPTVFDETMRYGVAIYNLAEKRYTTKFVSASYAALRPGERAWSPDGRWLAYSTGQGTRLMSITGEERVLPDASSFLLWSPDRASELCYLKDSSVFRYDVATKREDTVRTLSSYVNVFPVNGKACVSATDRHQAVVRELVTGKLILTIPYYQYAYPKTDGPEFLEMSPDGRFFLLDMSASGWSFVAISRSDDAKELLRKEHLAIFWQEGISGNSLPRILWPHSVSREGFQHARNSKYVYLGPKAIDIKTGSRGDSLVVQVEERICIERWPGHDGYLVITERGLYCDTVSQAYPPSNDKEPPLLPAVIDDLEYTI